MSCTQTPQEQFAEMIPEIQSRANLTFRHLDLEARQEAAAETIALCWRNYARCVSRGKQVAASSLAFYAALGVKAGRSLCGYSSTDVLAPRTQRLGRVTVVSLNAVPAAAAHDDDHAWWDRSDTLTDKRTWERPFERVRIAHDYGAFLSQRQVTEQERRVFNLLVENYRTAELAAELAVSPPRICQIKNALGRKLERFMGPDLMAVAAGSLSMRPRSRRYRRHAERHEGSKATR